MLSLEQIPMRKDNYSYALIKDDSVVMVDPSTEHESIEYFDRNPHLKLVAILNTHTHPDHVDGNEILVKTFGCPVYGPSEEKNRVSSISHGVSGGDELDLMGVKIKAFDVKAHTLGHLALLVDEPVKNIFKHGHHHDRILVSDLSNKKVIFVGDSLFGAGCGRLFEGTKENLCESLQFYRALDPNILMACGHEYTASNLKFADSILPKVSAIESRIKRTEELLAQEGATIPCFMADEFHSNPFLLALKDPHKSVLADKFGKETNDLSGIIAALRQAKDQF